MNKTGTDIPKCADGTYLYKLSSQNVSYYKCLACPLGCGTCSFTGSTVDCLTCSTGYNFVSGRCSPICDIRTSFLVVQNNSQYCQACDVSCIGCQGSASNCINCASNYKMGPTGCVLIQLTTVDCGQGYYDSASQSCKCTNFTTNFFNTATKTCDSIKDLQAICSSQTYYQVTAKACVSCSVKSCNLCPSDVCNQCVTGYFLNPTAQSCDSCPLYCDKCSSTNICQTCQAGYFRFKVKNTAGVDTQMCGTTCPTGQLPYLPSLYYLNPALFSPDQM